MTILSDVDLRAALDAGTIVVRPLAHGAVRPASVDLRLGPILTIPDPNEPNGWRVHDLRTAPYRLYQGSFVLGHTLEWIEVPPTLAGVLAGKSSRAREGWVLENAGYVDPGWHGELTVELTNLAPGHVLAMVGMLIGQIRFETLSSPCQKPYGSDASSRYQGSQGPVLSRAAVGGAS